MRTIAIYTMFVMSLAGSAFAQMCPMCPMGGDGQAQMGGQMPPGGQMPMMGGMMSGGQMPMGQMGPQMMKSGMMDDDGHMYWGGLAGLDLDDKQEAAIRDIKNKVHKEAIRKKADIEIAEIELAEAMDKEPADIKAAETALRKIEALKTDLRLSHIKAREEVKSKLTPEQKKKLDAGMGRMRPMMPMAPQRTPATGGDKKDDKGH